MPLLGGRGICRSDFYTVGEGFPRKHPRSALAPRFEGVVSDCKSQGRRDFAKLLSCASEYGLAGMYG